MRSEKALMQTSGRAARNVEGLVIFYADRITRSMKAVIDETARRRIIQEDYNTKHGITPTTIFKTHDEIMQSTSVADVASKRQDRLDEIKDKRPPKGFTPDEVLKKMDTADIKDLVARLKIDLEAAAAELAFEQAAELRDEIRKIEKLYLS